jgi:hypothetical protein
LGFCAAAAHAANFALVQQSPAGSWTLSGSLTRTFGAANTAGDTIIAIVYSSGSTPATVSDTRGNTYRLVQAAVTGNSIAIYAATSIAAGSNTVTATGGIDLFIAEYSSASPTYYVCPAIGITGGTGDSGIGITSFGSDAFQYVNTVHFTSTSEVMAVFSGYVSVSPGSPWTVTSGTIIYLNGFGGGVGGGVMAGNEDLSNLTGTYSNDITAGNFGTSGNRVGIFLNLTNPSCIGSTPVVHRHTFPILY